MIRLIASLFFAVSSFTYCFAEEVTFKHKNTRLSGHYLASTNGKPAKAILLFVHGDGAMTYDAGGYYNLIWEPLRQNGYAVFSWDKPNVGGSSGDWLEQTMFDRQSEVLAAIDFVQHRYNFTAQTTGLIGFSQAGWVLPAISNQNSKMGFVIGIGFATNWVEQGRYYTKIDCQLAGKNKKQISAALADYTKEISFLLQAPSYSEYVKFAGKKAMTKERFQFVLNNFKSDAKQDYSEIKVPSLYLWGEKDLNVNAKQEFASWKENNNSFVTTMLIANASHAMLNADSFSGQSIGALQWIKLMWLEQDAFAVEFIPTILAWLEQRNT
ncbi:alpha/beta hydrolase family protein [Agarivorans sp.]|uniref:alpha/beta hydrolase family protein n=1 Tax=Agarivorans sp. TaxID=1872412 RepID=UPI003D0017F5